MPDYPSREWVTKNHRNHCTQACCAWSSASESCALYPPNALCCWDKKMILKLQALRKACYANINNPKGPERRSYFEQLKRLGLEGKTICPD